MGRGAAASPDLLYGARGQRPRTQPVRRSEARDGVVTFSLPTAPDDPHREDGPAVLVPEHVGIYNLPYDIDDPVAGPQYVSGPCEIWFRHGVLHRTDGPAITKDGEAKLWYQNGKLHREDGPAWIIAGDDPKEQWYRHGKFVKTVYPDGRVETE